MQHTATANDATLKANATNDSATHKVAAAAHRMAAAAHELGNDADMKAKHEDMANQHEASAQRCKAAEGNAVAPLAVAAPATAALVAEVPAQAAAAASASAAGAVQAANPEGHNQYTETGGGFGTAKDHADKARDMETEEFAKSGYYNGPPRKVADAVSKEADMASEAANKSGQASDHLHAQAAQNAAARIHQAAAERPTTATKEYHEGMADVHKMKELQHKIAARKVDAGSGTTQPTALEAAAATRMAANPKLTSAVASLKASVAGGGYSLNDLQANVRDAISGVASLNTPNAAAPNSSSSCWVADLFGPVDEDDCWTAIVNAADGKLYAQDFDVDDDGSVTLDGAPEEVQRSTEYEWVNAMLETAASGAKAGLQAANPEGHNQYTTESSSGEKHFHADEDSAKAHFGKKAEFGDYEPNGEGRERMLVWRNAKEAENDDGRNAIGQVIRHTKSVNAKTSTPQPPTAIQAADSDAMPEQAVRKSLLADMATEAAGQSSTDAQAAANVAQHTEAEDAHTHAYNMHKDAYAQNLKAGAEDCDLDNHMAKMQQHQSAADMHKAMAVELTPKQTAPGLASAVADLNSAIKAAVADRTYPNFPFRGALEAGDFVGHPFRGNQYGAGGGSSRAAVASGKAHEATKGASTAADHLKAAAAHAKASILQSKKGNLQTAMYHDTMAQFHKSEAMRGAAIGASPSSAAATAATIKATKSDKPEDHAAAEAAHTKAKAVREMAGHGEAAKKHGEMAEKHHHMAMGRMGGGGGGHERKKKKQKPGEAQASNAAQPAAVQAASTEQAPADYVTAASTAADAASAEADKASGAADKVGDIDAHTNAKRAHITAYEAHEQAYKANTLASAPDTTTDKHMDAMLNHKECAADHQNAVDSLNACDARDARAIRSLHQRLAASDLSLKRLALVTSKKFSVKVTAAAVAKAITASDSDFDDGRDPFSEGFSSDSDQNPYDPVSEDGMQWQAGYDAAHEQSNGLDADDDSMGGMDMDAAAVRTVHDELLASRGTFSLDDVATELSRRSGRICTVDAVARLMVGGGLQASNPEGVNQYSGTGIHPTQKAYAQAKATHDAIKDRVDKEKAALTPPANGAPESEWMNHYAKEGAIEDKHGLYEAKDKLRGTEDKMIGAAKSHMERQPVYQNASEDNKASLKNLWDKGTKNPTIRPKLVDSAFKLNHGDGVQASAATTQPTAVTAAVLIEKSYLALHASARVAPPLKAAAAVVSGTWNEPGFLMYMPAGLNTITPSQGGRPVTVTLVVDASSADAVERQRTLLEAKGKKPFFSIQHGTEIAGFWPEKFSWGTRMDATGKYVEGVWADGFWTGSGKKARDEKDFRSFSPTFFVDEVKDNPSDPAIVVCNADARANMGALENDPAFGRAMSPIWASNASGMDAGLKGQIAAAYASLSAGDNNFTVTQLVAVLGRNGIRVTEDDAAQCLRA